MPILMTKLKNALKKKADTVGITLEFSITNEKVNGVNRGCSGFIRNTENGLIVYTQTEPSVLSSLTYMYRYAEGLKDYRGYHNRWTREMTLGSLVDEIITALQHPEWKARDFMV